MLIKMIQIEVGEKKAMRKGRVSKIFNALIMSLIQRTRGNTGKDGINNHFPHLTVSIRADGH